MAKVKKKAQFNSVSAAKSIAAAKDIIGNASVGTKNAAKTLTDDKKKLSATTKVLKKKQGILQKRRKIAAGKLKNKPGVDARVALKKVDKEIAGLIKEMAKMDKGKEASSFELANLKDHAKRLSGYLKAIKSVDKSMPKPKLAPKKKKSAKKSKTKMAKTPVENSQPTTSKKKSAKKSVRKTPSNKKSVKVEKSTESANREKIEMISNPNDMAETEASPSEVAVHEIADTTANDAKIEETGSDSNDNS